VVGAVALNGPRWTKAVEGNGPYRFNPVKSAVSSANEDNQTCSAGGNLALTESCESPNAS